MLRGNASSRLVDELKIDKDCFVDEAWIKDYVQLILWTCGMFGVTVVSVKMCDSRRKGTHFYISISPPIEANIANRLQWLLGDDCLRVDVNRARIGSGCPEWNKLFEKIGARLRTIYSLRLRIRRRSGVHDAKASWIGRS